MKTLANVSALGDTPAHKEIVPNTVEPYDVWQICLHIKEFSLWTGLSFVPAIQYKTVLDYLPSGSFMLAKRGES